jgi:hypothetical protein
MSLLWTSVLAGAALGALFLLRERIRWRYLQWRMGAQPIAEFGATLDTDAIHVFRGCSDDRVPWEDCKAHVAQFLGPDVVVVRDADGRIQGAHTRRRAVVFSTLLGTLRFNNPMAERACGGRAQVVIVALPNGPIDMGGLRAGMTGHDVGMVDELDCERLRALFARHRGSHSLK